PLDRLGAIPLNAAGLREIQGIFHDLHQAQHGHSARDQAIEVVSYRVRVRAPVPKQSLPKIEITDESPATPRGRRQITFDGTTLFDAPVYERSELTGAAGAALHGPAIIEQFDSTTVLPPGWTARLDSFANIIAEMEDQP
ncbi:MAG: hypothetical protein HQ514_20875, partial [Rhodospirillales bacterium]|nr:hypothetical protein [Rhodospirillales bacterium]